MKRQDNRGAKNQLSPSILQKRMNRLLFVGNLILCIVFISVGISQIQEKEYISAAGALLGALATGGNATMAWLRLKGKNI